MLINRIWCQVKTDIWNNIQYMKWETIDMTDRNESF